MVDGRPFVGGSFLIIREADFTSAGLHLTRQSWESGIGHVELFTFMQSLRASKTWSTADPSLAGAGTAAAETHVA